MQRLMKAKTEECDKLNQELVRVSEAHRASEASLRLTMTKHESAVSAARQDLAEVRKPVTCQNRAQEHAMLFRCSSWRSKQALSVPMHTERVQGSESPGEVLGR